MYKCLKFFVNGSCWLIGGDIENEAEDDIFTYYLYRRTFSSTIVMTVMY